MQFFILSVPYQAPLLLCAIVIRVCMHRFAQNSAAASGAALYMNGSSLEFVDIVNSSFINNTAGQPCGARCAVCIFAIHPLSHARTQGCHAMSLPKCGSVAKGASCFLSQAHCFEHQLGNTDKNTYLHNSTLLDGC